MRVQVGAAISRPYFSSKLKIVVDEEIAAKPTEGVLTYVELLLDFSLKYTTIFNVKKDCCRVKQQSFFNT